MYEKEIMNSQRPGMCCCSSLEIWELQLLHRLILISTFTATFTGLFVTKTKDNRRADRTKPSSAETSAGAGHLLLDKGTKLCLCFGLFSPKKKNLPSTKKGM